MRVALLGGTGDIGEGLALRWAAQTNHEIVIGSRDADKAASRADDYHEEITTRGTDCTIRGTSNPEACVGADVVVLSVPAMYVAQTVEAVADTLDDDAILVSPAVNMERDENGFHYVQPSDANSVTAVAAEAAPPDIPVVGAFHNISADRLADLDSEISMDTLIVGDDSSATATVGKLAEEIDGLRAVSAGSIANAKEVESITPLLINIAIENEGMHHIGVQFE